MRKRPGTRFIRVVPPGARMKVVGDYVYIVHPDMKPVRMRRGADADDPKSWETVEAVE